MTARTAHPDVIAGGTTQDHIEMLRAELRAVTDRLDAYLADLARPRLTAVMTTAAPAGPDPLDGLPPLIGVEQAAKVLGLSRAAAYRLAAADELPVRRLGGRVYVATAGLRALLDGAA
ncbi:helix-turn-helix domain-containing protein [Candidatus Frankia alpina]|uniref:Helix-turn-helix domain-containing protein n=1 Tax=Candidatus Frankia alpina TaxID=2699483 RepID=A0A4S5ET76_9ACTN|nr:helix-turn-helix domain-containing protein [Candidatus Frankia alpina]THJ75697.1 helix-turn-helix domain-containing protein [Candidatus Frankia alpina]